MRALIAQLSDIHIKNADDVILDRTEEIAKAINSVCQEHDFIIIALTGDLTYSGKEDEFVLASSWTDSIITHLKAISPSANVKIVTIPGNHDCDFGDPQDVRNILLESLKKRDVPTPDMIKLIAACQLNFFSYRDAYASEGLKVIDELYWEYEFTKGDESIGFMCLNSAWTSQMHEQQGSLIYHHIYSPTITPTLTLTLTHHPLHWLRLDQSKELAKHIYTKSSIFLTGHEHDSDYTTRINRKGEILKYIEGGALQDPTSKDSIFNVIIADTSLEKQQVHRFAWQSDAYRWLDGEEPEWDEYQVKRYRKSMPFEISESFKKELDDPGLHLTNRSVGNVKLSDIYVLPDFRIANLGDTERTPVRGNLFYEVIEERKNLVILAGEQQGKTALCKHLFLRLHEQGRVPIMMDSKHVMNRIDDSFYKKLKREVSRQYSTTLVDKYLQLDKAERILIVDNYSTQKFGSDRERWVKCLEALHEFFDFLIFVSDDVLDQLEEILRGDFVSDGFKLSRLRMQSFGHVKRKELVEKWFSLGTIPDDSEEFATSVYKVESALSHLFGRGYAPSIPSYILPILQTHESLVDLEVSAASRAHLSRRLIDDALNSTVRSQDRPTREGFLMFLANNRFETGNEVWDSTTFDMLWEQYKASESLTLQRDKVVTELVEAGLLRSTGEDFSFNYPYVYHAYAAHRFSLKITNPETRLAVEKMVGEVYKEDYANILLFLSNLNQEDYILNGLLEVARSVYSSNKLAQFEDELSPLNELLNELNQIKSLPVQEKKTHVQRMSEQDEIEENTESIDEASGPLVELNRSLKSLQIIGQILKITVGTLGKERKYEVTKVCIELGLRTISAIMELVLGNKEEVLKSIYMMIRRQYGILDSDQSINIDDEMRKRALIAIILLSQDICYGLIKRISTSIGTADLELVFRELRDEYQTTATEIIHLTIELEHVSLRKKNLLDAAEKMEDNPFAFHVLKSVVRDYLYLNRPDYKIKTALCDKFNIDRNIGTDTKVKLIDTTR